MCIIVPTMKPKSLRSWMIKHSLTEETARVKLGISRSSLRDYLSGKYPIKLGVAYTCAAIDAGIEPLK